MTQPPRPSRPHLSRWRRLSVTLAVAATASGIALVALADTEAPRASGDDTKATTTTLPRPTPSPSPSATPSRTVTTVASALGPTAPLRGMPPVLDPTNLYAAAGANMLSAAVKGDPYRIYVPDSGGSSVEVIDPTTMQIVGHYQVGRNPQHIVPSYDMKTLYATNDIGNSLTAFNPKTGLPIRTIPVADPYNMYFTPDGKNAIVVSEALQRLDFRDPHTFALKHRLQVHCPGVDHMDFSANGGFLLATCEFSSRLVEVNLHNEQVVRYIQLPGGSPQDIKLDPTGHVFYIADRWKDGVWLINARTFKTLRFIHTGRDAHGLYPSRDGTKLYVTNRRASSVTVINFATQRIVATWQIPGGGTPDMGNTSPDGKVLWLAGRYSSEVYAISTVDGHLIGKIAVGLQPHGLCVWPQPGRYSLGHTGVTR